MRGRRRELHRHEIRYRLLVDTNTRRFGPLLGFTNTFFAGFTIVAGLTGRIAWTTGSAGVGRRRGTGELTKSGGVHDGGRMHDYGEFGDNEIPQLEHRDSVVF